MNSETCQCRNCKQNFTIESEDFAFYEKIKVPSPTFCPDCRLQRRLSYKNERTLYKRQCDLCGNDSISIFPPDAVFPVYCPTCWYSDKWDRTIYGQEYDPNKNFFVQYKELVNRVPKCGLYIDLPRTVGDHYLNLTGPMKNCYLMFLAEDCEECMFSSSTFGCKNSLDCYKNTSANNSYELFSCYNCYNCAWSMDMANCVNVYFSTGMVNCSDCFGCNNLTSKKYHVFNKPYSREDYFKEIARYDMGSHRIVEGHKKNRVESAMKYPKRYMYGYQNDNVSGNDLYQCKNVKKSFEVIGGQDNKYCHVVNMPPSDHCYDYGDWGNSVSYMYESVNCGENMSNIKFCYACWVGQNQEYCDVVINCNDVFGCVSLRNQKYCILNKQYSPEEYAKLRARVIEDMNNNPYLDKRGRVYKYGEFFPAELSVYSYNETIAQEYFPITEEEAGLQGYPWHKVEEKDYGITLPAEKLPDNIKEVDEGIMEEVIGCAHGVSPAGGCDHHCSTAFKIIPSEYEFYKRFNYPIPRLCPNCRHAERVKFRNPLKLWPRGCQCSGHGSSDGVYQNTVSHQHGAESCLNKFETSYSPERPEIIYCEECYQREVS
ncbi:MAG TPA: hypothetical protein VJL32_01525 [Candidatus Paceibacterota bacterium]